MEKEELIDISEEQDRNYWANRLGVTVEKLKSAVRELHSVEFSKLDTYLNFDKIKHASKYQQFARK